ncbi:MAG TPA: hypothetical protein PKD49_14330 [Hyphomicrobium sp.]|nr:hypothetical protein [Hyphomicrobium sp.]
MARIWASFIYACIFACAAQANAQSLPEYKTVSIDGPDGARIVAVRLNERISEQALYDIASDLSAKRKSAEELASISFFLPKADLAAQPWAIARFADARPSVSILGLRAEEEALFRSEAQHDTRDVVGVWLTSPPALPGKLTILKSKDGFIAEWHLRSGEKTFDNVSASQTPRGVRYTVAGGEGAYYLATRGGELLLGDATRIIATAERLPVDPRAEPAPVAAQAGAVQPAGKEPTGISSTASAPPAATLTARPRERRAARVPAAREGASVADLMRGAVAR